MKTVYIESPSVQVKAVGNVKEKVTGDPYVCLASYGPDDITTIFVQCEYTQKPTKRKQIKRSVKKYIKSKGIEVVSVSYHENGVEYFQVEKNDRFLFTSWMIENAQPNNRMLSIIKESLPPELQNKHIKFSVFKTEVNGMIYYCCLSGKQEITDEKGEYINLMTPTGAAALDALWNLHVGDNDDTVHIQELVNGNTPLPGKLAGMLMCKPEYSKVCFWFDPYEDFAKISILEVLGLTKGTVKIPERSYETLLESPIEKMFWGIAKHKVSNIVPQHNVDKYRIDFAIPDKNVAIELDGHEFHKTKKQRTNDARRERYLQEQGWTVIRFTGNEIFKDAEGCVKQVNRIVDKITE